MIEFENNNYYTVKEFAAAANISNKAVYQQLKTRLKDYSKSIGGVIMICETALQAFYSDDSSIQVKSSQVDLNLEHQEEFRENDKYITFLEQEIRDYKEQLREKDKTISEMQQQIITLSNNLAAMSSESLQQIASITKNIQLLQAAEVQEEIIKNQETEIKEIIEKPKKSFWDRLRGK